MPAAYSPQQIEGIITQVANSYGLDPRLAIADARYESGLNPNAVGDNGTSFGLYQLHEGGELGNNTQAWADNPYNNAQRALSYMAQVARQHPGMDPGQIAAMAERPANPQAYAQQVDALMGSWGGIPYKPGYGGGAGTGMGSPGSVYNSVAAQNNQYTQTQLDLANQLYGYQQTGFNLQQQGEQQNLANELAQFGIQQSNLNLSQQQLQDLQKYQGQQYGFQQQGFGLQGEQLGQQIAQTKYNTGQNILGQESSAAASGSTVSSGNRRALGNIKEQGGYQLQQLSDAQKNLQLQEKEAGSAFKYSQQQDQIQAQQIQNELKSLGLSETQAKQQAALYMQQLQNQRNIAGAQNSANLANINQSGLNTQLGLYSQGVGALSNLAGANQLNGAF